MENIDKGKKPNRGSTVKNRGPWIVRRATKKGTVTCLRFPSDFQREKNKIRERMRRMVTSKIFSGLRAHGGYNLPNNADNNLVLIALCEEAGWHVQQDGSISRKDLNTNDGVADRHSVVIEDNRINLTLSL